MMMMMITLSVNSTVSYILIMKDTSGVVAKYLLLAKMLALCIRVCGSEASKHPGSSDVLDEMATQLTDAVLASVYNEDDAPGLGRSLYLGRDQQVNVSGITQLNSHINAGLFPPNQTIVSRVWEQFSTQIKYPISPTHRNSLPAPKRRWPRTLDRTDISVDQLRRATVNVSFSLHRVTIPDLIRTVEAKKMSSSGPMESAITSDFSSVTGSIGEPKDEIHLRFRTEEMKDCFVHSKVKTGLVASAVEVKKFYRNLIAPKGSIVGEPQFNTTSGTMQACALKVTVAVGAYVVVEILQVMTRSFTRVLDTTSKGIVHDNTLKNTKGNLTAVFVGSSNVATLVIQIDTTQAGDRFVIKFRTLTNQPGLQVHRTAFNRGFVQTPLYSVHALLLNPLPKPWAYINIPAGHVIMSSWPTFELNEGRVTVYAGDRGNQSLEMISYSDVEPPRPTVYNTTSLLIHFDARYSTAPSYIGFQFRYSVHSHASLPTKLPDSLWNCSVPYMSDFLFHLSCNVETECHDAEDERNCSYSTDLCGPGFMTLGGACLFYLWRWKERVSWTEASQVCSLRGGRLAILDTKDKWTGFVRLLPVRRGGVSKLLLGIRHHPSILPLWYADTPQWSDTTTAFYIDSKVWITRGCEKKCGFYTIRAPDGIKKSILHFHFGCNNKIKANVLCEKPTAYESPKYFKLINDTDRWSRDTTYSKCPLGHYTHRFLACDVKSSCWFSDRTSQCEWPQALSLPSFACTSQMERVPYTLVCDHRGDCADDSDEDFCRVPPCTARQFSCGNKQCITSTKQCDGWGDCRNGADEAFCYSELKPEKTVAPPALVSLSKKGLLAVYPLNITRFTDQDGACPSTHFQCLDNGYCLPVFLRCNDVNDCPGREDETGCEMCPGFYRCRGSHVCLHHGDLCDGHALCPQHDDELTCDSTCPPFCVCRGLAFFCTHSFTASAYPLLRFLDASGSGMTPVQMAANPLLIRLSLAECGLTRLDGLCLPNLLTLDIHDNQLIVLSHKHLSGVPQLTELSVAGNPLVSVFQGVEGLGASGHLLELDLSRVVMHVINVTLLSAFPDLRELNLSHTGLQRVQGEGFRIIDQLRLIDLRGCPLTWFPRGLFKDLHHLHTVHAANFKVCCPAVLPVNFKLPNCLAPSDEISSCDNLLRGNVYRVCAFVLSALAIAGNFVSFLFRTRFSKRETKLGYGNFVTHLSVADFLMGVYLAVIGMADLVYRGTYLWNDVIWRHSTVCQFAGFLSLLSSEISVLIVCLITLDRFLVLRFPFSQIHFSSRSAHVASVVAWMCGLLLASVPLLPVTSHWEFYSQTGICIPLPVTRTQFAGQDYSFSILIVFNFVIFLFISSGQMSIYWSVRANSMSVSSSTKKTKDLTIARRLITVAMSDFLCWFPIGVLGLMASSGVPISGEVNVAVAIFVLPLNSAANPCLYTFNVIIERHRRIREEKLRAFLHAQLKTRD